MRSFRAKTFHDDDDDGGGGDNDDRDDCDVDGNDDDKWWKVKRSHPSLPASPGYFLPFHHPEEPGAGEEQAKCWSMHYNRLTWSTKGFKDGGRSEWRPPGRPEWRWTFTVSLLHVLYICSNLADFFVVPRS